MDYNDHASVFGNKNKQQEENRGRQGRVDTRSKLTVLADNLRREASNLKKAEAGVLGLKQCLGFDNETVKQIDRELISVLVIMKSDIQDYLDTVRV